MRLQSNSPQNLPDEDPASRIALFFWLKLSLAVMSLVIFWFVMPFFGIYKVPSASASMEGEIFEGDRVLATAWYSSVHRGDVIAFRLPAVRIGEREIAAGAWAKRCVAIPCDTLQIVNRILFVNGQQAPIPRNLKFDLVNPVKKDEIDPDIFPHGASWNRDNWGPVVVPFSGMRISIDTQSIQLWSNLLGQEGNSMQKWQDSLGVDGNRHTQYVVQRDYYFVLGDHRDNSLDSRYFGFVAENNIYAKPFLVYWSYGLNSNVLENSSHVSPSIRWSRIGALIK